MNVGYMQGTYWHTAYFTEDYFQVYGEVEPTPGGVGHHDDHRRRSRIAAHIMLVGRI